MSIQSVKKANDMQGNLSNVWITYDDGKILCVPIDPDNTDYQQYLEWTKASPMNVALPADEVTE